MRARRCRPWVCCCWCSSCMLAGDPHADTSHALCLTLGEQPSKVPHTGPLVHAVGGGAGSVCIVVPCAPLHPCPTCNNRRRNVRWVGLAVGFAPNGLSTPVPFLNPVPRFTCAPPTKMPHPQKSQERALGGACQGWRGLCPQGPQQGLQLPAARGHGGQGGLCVLLTKDCSVTKKDLRVHGEGGGRT